MAIGPIGERLQAAAILVARKPISRSMHGALCLAHTRAGSWAGLVARAMTCFRSCFLVFSLGFTWFFAALRLVLHFLWFLLEISIF
jgi:hypothetical protein